MAFVRRPYRGSVTVDVEVDINDVLREMDDDYLRDELKARGEVVEDLTKKQQKVFERMFDEMRDAVAARSFDEVLAVIDAYERPKWKAPQSCEKDYLAAIGKTPTPPTRSMTL